MRKSIVAAPVVVLSSVVVAVLFVVHFIVVAFVIAVAFVFVIKGLPGQFLVQLWSASAQGSRLLLLALLPRCSVYVWVVYVHMCLCICVCICVCLPAFWLSFAAICCICK